MFDIRVSTAKIRFLWIIIIISGLTSCRCHDSRCGTGVYKCTLFNDTDPYKHPIKNDILNNSILFEDGILLKYNSNYEDHFIINLDSICGSDSIRDIICYNEHLDSHIYSYDHPDGLPQPQDFFNLAVSPNKCCILDTSFIKTAEFGMTGPTDAILCNAVSGAIDLQGRCYIADRADGSVKVYDKNGVFIVRWPYVNARLQIKLWDDILYALDDSTGQISKTSMAGNNYGNQPGISGASQVVAFGFTYERMIWIADQNGTRLSQFSLSGDLKEVKTNYCFDDMNYNFTHIAYIDGFLDVFELVDRDANRILSFGTGPTD